MIEPISQLDGKVILVGHSFGGMVITAVAEQIPNRIEKLMYVAGFLPASGQSALALASTDKNSLLGPSLVPSADQLTLGVKTESIIPVVCQDGSPEIQKLAMDNYKAEPAIPFTNSMVLTDANFGRVSRIYIHTLQDHNISIDLQNRMVAATKVDKEYTLDSSLAHSFLCQTK